MDVNEALVYLENAIEENINKQNEYANDISRLKDEEQTIQFELNTVLSNIQATERFIRDLEDKRAIYQDILNKLRGGE